MPPTIDVFITSILSNPALRGRHERVRRAMTAARVPYAEHDVASDEAAKSMWKRKNGGKNELPFLLVDGEPVGTVDELDEAVEFGELRQFLRLDQPSSSSSTAAPPSSSTEASSSSKAAASSTSSRPKPSLDDFADLDLTPSELAQLKDELEKGDSFSSGLLDPSSSGDRDLNFSTATQRFTPSFSPTAPLKVEKINFTRPLPDRPLASEVVKDELEGIETGSLDEDELEKLMKEMEAEEEERRRLRDAQQVGEGVEPPPLPEKPDEEEGTPKSPRLPAKDVPPSFSSPPPPASSSPSSSPSADLASTTPLPGPDGGAALSAPLAEIEKLSLSSSSLAELDPSSVPSKLDVAEAPVTPISPPSLSSSAEMPGTPEQQELEREERRQKEKTTPRSAALLKSELFLAASGADDADPERLRKAGGSLRVSEMPDFTSRAEDEDEAEGKDKEGGEEEKGREESTDGLADRVAEAIRGGDL
ncbi:hypothetical protein JCM8547_009236 [Rhodosporidiobolus lusitaniae]